MVNFKVVPPSAPIPPLSRKEIAVPAGKISPAEVAAAICAPLVNDTIKRLRTDSATAHDLGYGAYSRILSDMASRVEKAQSDAIDELEKVTT